MVRPGGRVLDLGCGAGVPSTRRLAESFSKTLDSGERALVEAPNDGNAPRFSAGDALWFTAPRESCFEMPQR